MVSKETHSGAMEMDWKFWTEGSGLNSADMVPSVWDKGCWHIFTVTYMIIFNSFSSFFLLLFCFTAFWAHCQMPSCRDSWGRVRWKMRVNVVSEVHVPLWKPCLCSCSSHVDTVSAQWQRLICFSSCRLFSWMKSTLTVLWQWCGKTPHTQRPFLSFSYMFNKSLWSPVLFSPVPLYNIKIGFVVVSQMNDTWAHEIIGVNTIKCIEDGFCPLHKCLIIVANRCIYICRHEQEMLKF